jgi:hypothetical protein
LDEDLLDREGAQLVRSPLHEELVKAAQVVAGHWEMGTAT